jgi:RNA polymerase sigma-70 factor (ECF subfamily)
MAEAPEPRDVELLRWLAAGDENSFLLFYRRYQGALYRFALHMTGSPDAAADVVQETFLAVIRGTAKYDPIRGAAGAFLFGVARNHVHRLLEKESRFVALSDSETELEAASSASSGNGNGNGNRTHPAKAHHGFDAAIDGLSQGEIVVQLRAAITLLPEHYREVVTLCDLEGKSYEQVASLLDCPIGTVRSRLNRARNLLTEKMRKKSAVKQSAGSDTKALRTTGR